MSSIEYFMNCDWEYEYSKDEIFQMERENQIMNEYYQWVEQEALKDRKPAIIEVIIKKPKHETNNNTLPF